MSEDHFDVIFSGVCLSGYVPEKVRANVQLLFHLDDARLDILFSGQPVFIKKNINKETASKYQEIFRKAGASQELIKQIKK